MKAPKLVTVIEQADGGVGINLSGELRFIYDKSAPPYEKLFSLDRVLRSMAQTLEARLAVNKQQLDQASATFDADPSPENQARGRKLCTQKYGLQREFNRIATAHNDLYDASLRWRNICKAKPIFEKEQYRMLERVERRQVRRKEQEELAKTNQALADQKLHEMAAAHRAAKLAAKEQKTKEQEARRQAKREAWLANHKK